MSRSRRNIIFTFFLLLSMGTIWSDVNMIAKWSGLQQSKLIVDDAVDQWRERLRYCVETSGRHFEHLL